MNEERLSETTRQREIDGSGTGYEADGNREGNVKSDFSCNKIFLK